MLQNSLSIRPSGGGVGAFVEDIDLGHLDDTQAAALKAAIGEHGVLFFREQDIDHASHLAMAEHFGGVNVNRFFAHVAEEPRIAEVRKEPGQKSNIGGGWHTDHSYDQVPAMGSILIARETPPCGGDTLFANMYAAYDSLSDGLKATLEGMNAEHSSRHVFGRNAKRYQDKENDIGERVGNKDEALQDATHPVVIRHPFSGRKALYVNPGFTLRFEGWTDAESKPLLDYLYQHAARPEHTYRFQWANGSVAFWDNRATWHYAVNDYHGHRRLMHRVTIEGEAIGR